MRDVTRSGNLRRRLTARLGAGLAVGGLVAAGPLLVGAGPAYAAPATLRNPVAVDAEPGGAVSLASCASIASCARLGLPTDTMSGSYEHEHSVGGFFEPAAWSSSDWALSGFLVTVGGLLVAVASALAYYAGRWPGRAFFRSR
jgi:hypothetical protein